MNIENIEMNRRVFLKAVQKYIEYDPGASAYVAACVQEGIKNAFESSEERAADMEVALFESIHGGTGNELIKKKLKKWDGRTSLEWDWFFKEIDPK